MSRIVALIEDDYADAERARRALADLEIEIHTLECGSVGIEFLRNNAKSIGVIAVDMVLGFVTGQDVIRFALANDIPIVAVTGEQTLVPRGILAVSKHLDDPLFSRTLRGAVRSKLHGV